MASNSPEKFIPSAVKGPALSAAAGLGWLSAALASVCCVLPLAAVLVGLGSVGLGSMLGGISIYFQLGGLLVLGFAWFYFLRGRRRACVSNACVSGLPAQAGERRTVVALSVATAFVVLFAGMGLAPRLLRTFAAAPALAGASQTGLPGTASVTQAGAVENAPGGVAGAYLRKVLAVKGMDCAACVPEIEHSLAGVPGVRATQVSLRNQTVTIEYDPAKVSVDRLVGAIKKAGYDARG
jgi:copper chaperone CopZ